MSDTLLEIVSAAAAELNLPVPTQVVGNTNNQVVQLYALCNALGKEVSRKEQWEQLNIEYRFTTEYLITTGDTTDGSAIVTNIPSTSGLSTNYMVNGTGINNDTYILSVDSATQVTLSQACTETNTAVTLNFGQTKYNLPSDWDRQINRTHYDKSKRWEMLGPETPQQWQFLKSSYISTGPRIRYRIMGGQFQIWPVITTNEYLGFEYISKNWALSSTGTTQASFLADTDTCIFPDRLMILGLKKKFLDSKGLDSKEVTADYIEQMNIAKAAEAGAATLSLSPQPASILIGYENIPDGSIYGQG